MKSIRILLVEDDADDIELLKESFELSNVSCSFDVVTEGDKVLPFLEECTALPDVIVMDLNLPRRHGREIMRDLCESERFKKIPLVVVTTSSLQDDRDFSYSMGARRFITKPNSIEGFRNTVQAIVDASGPR